MDIRSFSPPEVIPTRVKQQHLPLPARRHPLVQEVACRLSGECGFEHGTRLGIALSGGADSMALLGACVVLRDREDDGPCPDPVAVHVHHHLRGVDADTDAAVAEATCGTLDIPFRLAHIHPAESAGNLARQARDLRYEALAGEVRDAGGRCLCTAHHADDQLETLLMALGRGAGPTGLGAMPWRRTLPGSGMALLRPMLNLRHEDARDFCSVAGLAWREDPTNLDPSSVRGRLRTSVIPELESLWPSIAAHATRSTEWIRATEAAFTTLVEDVFGPASMTCWQRDMIRDAGRSIICAGLHRAIRYCDPAMRDRLGARILNPAIDAIVSKDTTPRSYDLARGIRLEVLSRMVRLVQDDPGTETAASSPIHS